jgi:tetratricopeptide (TPR) repeat protein/DNA-binding SARP family transcriptional activator
MKKQDAFIQMMGGPRVHVAHSRVDIPPLGRWLLFVVHQHRASGISRDSAASLLWSSCAKHKASQRLRQLIYDTTTKVGTPLLMSDAGVLRLVVDSDLDKGLTHSRLRQLTQDLCPLGSKPASSCLPLLLPAPTTRAEGFRRQEERVLRGHLRAAAAAMWDLAEQTANWDDAVTAARLLLWLDPHSPRWIRRFIIVALANDRPASAEALLTRLDSTAYPQELHDELHRLIRQRGTRPDLKGESNSALPFVGRAQELKVVADRILSAGESSTTVILGELGIGKSRFLSELRTKLELRGVQVHWASCTPGNAHVPFTVLADIIDPLRGSGSLPLADPWKDVVLHLSSAGTDESERRLPFLKPDATRLRLQEGIARLFESLASTSPQAILVDDAHWADPTSLDVVRAVLSRRACPLAFVCALPPHPLPFPTALWVGHDVNERSLTLSLPPLSPDDAGALASACLLARGETTTRAGDLARASGGHPLLITALAAAGVSGTADLSPPEHWRRAAEQGLSHCTWQGRAVFSILVLLGPTSLDTLAAVLCLDAFEVADHLRDGVARGWVTHTAGQYQFPNQLMAEAIRVALGPPLLQVAHRQVASYLRSSGKEARLGDVAFHMFHGGETAGAAQEAYRAAKSASERGALAEAGRFYELAVTASGNDPSASLLRDAGNCQLLQCHLLEGVAFLRRAEAAFTADGSTAAFRRTRICRINAESEAGLLRHAEAARQLAELRRDALSANELPTFLAGAEAELRVLEREGAPGRIRTVLADISCQQSRYVLRDACHAHMLLALKVFYGDTSEALVHAREALQLATRTNDRDLALRARHRLYVVMIYCGLGAHSQADECYRILVAHSQRVGDVRMQYTTLSNRAVWLMELGAYLDAATLLRNAGRNLPESARGEQLNLLLNLGECALHQRDFLDAFQIFSRAQEQVDAGTRDFLRDVVHAGLGLAALENGQLDHARASFQALRPWSEWCFDPTMILTFRARWLTRLGQVRDAIQMLEEHAAMLHSRYPTIWIRVQVLSGRIARRYGYSSNREDLKAAKVLAARLGLPVRVAELQDLLQ